MGKVTNRQRNLPEIVTLKKILHPDAKITEVGEHNGDIYLVRVTNGDTKVLLTLDTSENLVITE